MSAMHGTVFMHNFPSCQKKSAMGIKEPTKLIHSRNICAERSAALQQFDTHKIEVVKFDEGG